MVGPVGKVASKIVDKLRPPAKDMVLVRRIGNGPFKGRIYLVNRDGSLGRRVR